MLILKTPTKLYLDLPDSKIDELRPHLHYKDQVAQQAYNRFKKAFWYVNKFGQEAHQERLEELKAEIDVNLIFEDEGGIYTHSGTAPRLEQLTNSKIVNEVTYPDEGLLGYEIKPYVLRPYQITAIERMMAQRHAAVSMVTGCGKSLVLMELVKRHGLRALIVTPSVSIARQMYKEFQRLFGRKKVGLYGDGRHDIDKYITIAIAASLVRVKPGSDIAIELQQAQVVCFDESHLTPAETQAKLCLGLLADIPYRYFVSGTQFRNDGSDLLLEAITGPVVFEYNLQQAVDEGYLAKPNFRMMKVPADCDFMSSDVLELMTAHVYKNRLLHEVAADIANKAVSLLGHEVLILVEHIDQFQYLLPYLRYEVGFAHGGLDKENKKTVDSRFHKSDTEQLVQDFNEGKIKILVGTSCVGIGTDFRGVKTIIYLQGGKSEIKLCQAIGRGTRKPEGKTEFHFFDFDVELPINYSPLKRHADIRRKIYQSLYPDSFREV